MYSPKSFYDLFMKKMFCEKNVSETFLTASNYLVSQIDVAKA